VISELTLRYNGIEKLISFSKDGKDNLPQIDYINAVFELTEKGKLILKNTYKEFAYFGAYRCSKSFSQQLAVFLICLLYPGTRAVYIRNSYDQLKDSVIKQFNDAFGELNSYEYAKSNRTITFKNGSTLIFRSFETDKGILSSEYDVVCVCQAEDITYDMFLQLLGRASGRVLGPKGILLVEGNPSAGWVKTRYKDATIRKLEEDAILFIEGQTSDNPFVTKEYCDSLVKNYPKFWLDRFFYGKWSSLEEMVFSEFKDDMIIDPVDPLNIPASYKKRNGLDYGWTNKSAIYRSYIDYEGNITLYDEFYENKTLPEDLAKWTNKYGDVSTVADHACKGLKMPTKDDENKTVWTEMERFGAKLIPCNKNQMGNIVLVNTLMKQGRFKITKNCVNGIREIKNWKWKKAKLGSTKNDSEKPVDKEDHLNDAMLYLIADLFGKHATDPVETAFKRSLAFKTQQKSKIDLASLS